MFNEFLERNPHLGIVASIAGFFGSIISLLQAISVAIGLIGAVFGCVAGFYTWRIKRHQWEREYRGDRLSEAKEDRAERKQNDAEDRQSRIAQESEDRELRNK